MHAVAFWVAVASAAVVGRIAGASAPASARAWGVAVLAAVLASLCAGGAVVAVRDRLGPSVRRIGWACAIVLVGVRALAGASAESPPWREARRGPASGLRDLVVVEASEPGSRCSVAARVGQAGDAVRLLLPSQACPLGAGDVVRLRAEEAVARTWPALPGDGDPLASSPDVVATIAVDRAWIVARASGPSHAIASLRQAAWDVSRDDRADAFVVAMGLGLREALSPGDRRALRESGLAHLVAVSGLNVAIAAWLAASLLSRIGTLAFGSLATGMLAGWAALAAYAIVTGAAPPVVRAALMAGLVGLGAATGRQHHGIALLVVASGAMLAVRPAWIADPGFQLSVIAMLAIVAMPRDAGVIEQTWRVTWAVVPIGLWHFAQAGAWAVVANVIAVPVVTIWVLPLGLLGCLAAPWLGSPALEVAAWGGRIVLAVADVVAQWPAAPPWLVAVLAGAGLVATIAIGRRAPIVRRIAPPPVAALATIAVVLAQPWAPLSPSDAAWVAIGSSREPSAIVRAPGDSSAACLVDAAVPGARLPGLLAALGVSRVASVTAWPGRSDDAPHLVEVREALRRRGLLDQRAPPCPVPDKLSVRRALRACRRLAGSGIAVAEVDAADALRCFVHGELVDAGRLPVPPAER